MATATVAIAPPDAAEQLPEPWVDAAPFRAQLRFLMAVAGLTSAEVAVLAGLSPRLTGALLSTRTGRPLRRINPEYARRLLRLTPSGLAAVAHREVVADLAQRPAQRLREEGWTTAELAAVLGLPVADTSALLEGHRRTCGQMVAVRAAARAALLGDEEAEADEDGPLELGA